MQRQRDPADRARRRRRTTQAQAGGLSFNHHVTRHFLERVNRKKPLEQLLYPASPRGAARLDVSPARARSWRLLGDKEHRETARPGTQARPARITSSKTSPGDCCPGLAESQKESKRSANQAARSCPTQRAAARAHRGEDACQEGERPWFQALAGVVPALIDPYIVWGREVGILQCASG